MLNITRRIARYLFRLKAEPANEDLLTLAHEQLDNHGIDFFNISIRMVLSKARLPAGAGSRTIAWYGNDEFHSHKGARHE